MTRRSDSTAPPKPYPDFPLYAHRNGQWAKRIGGKIRYFGSWDDPQAAVDLYQLQREALRAGREPPLKANQVNVALACNAFLTSKLSLRNSGDLTPRTYADYESTCKRIIAEFGRERTLDSLLPSDFDTLRESLSKSRGPIALGNEIVRVRSIFNYSYQAAIIPHPIRFGPHFKRPSAKSMRLARSQSGLRMFTPEELNAVLAIAKEPMRAMILLGINCGLGNSDIGKMELHHLDIKGLWLNYPRPKTGIPRRARLWKETADSLKRVLARRKTQSNLVFITKYGTSWSKDNSKNPISNEMAKLLDQAGVRRPGLNFYALRHTFQTIGEECGDHVAVQAVMGHAPHVRDMGAVYREQISDLRLMRLSEHVRAWLRSGAKTQSKASREASRKNQTSKNRFSARSSAG